MRINVKDDLKRGLVVCLAATIMAINIKSFVRAGGLFPGGASGLTLLIQRSMEMFFGLEVPYTLINISLNAFPVFIGFRYIGKKFTMFSCLMIVLGSVLTDLIPGYTITYDILLISIFGGLINGCVISLCLMVNATSGGTDFIAIFLSDRKGIDSWNMILAFNVVILSIAGFLFGWDKALYSIIFQYTSTQVLHILYKKYQQVTVFAVTNREREVCESIAKVSNHGATILQGEGSYEGKDRSVVYSVVSGADSKKVLSAIKQADENAFINVIKTEKLNGKFYYKPNE